MSRLPALLAISLFLLLPAHATLLGGLERSVTLPTPDVAAFDQSQGRLASDGRSFFAVWQSRHASNLPGEVFGAFVSDEGQRTSEPILLGNGDAPIVAFANGRYLALWILGSSLQGRFIDANGTLSNELEIAPSGARDLHLASNGSVFLAVWLDQPLTYRATFIHPNGTIEPAFDLMTAQLRAIGDVVAIDDTFYALTSFVDITGTPNGNGYPAAVKAVPIGGGATIDIAPAETPVFDLQGSGNRVAWTTAAGVAGGKIRSALITPEGASAIESFDAEGLRLDAIAGDVLFYGDDRTTFTRRVGGAASILNAPAAQGTVSDAVSNGSAVVLLFQGTPRVGFDVGPAGGDLYSASLATQTFTPLVFTPRHQEFPDVAAASDLRLAAWSEYIGRDRRLGVVATRIGIAGHTIDGDGIDLGVATYHPTSPRVASNGTDFLVTWVDGVTLYAKRVSHSGRVLDATPITLGKSVYSNDTVAVGWDGRSYVVAFLRGGFFKGIRVRVVVVRVSAAGDVEPDLVLTNEGPFQNIAVAAGGDGSLIVWDTAGDFNAVLLSRTNVATPLLLADLFHPSVAWNGREFLVAGFRGRQLQWQFVSATGIARTPSSTFLDLRANPAAVYGFPSVDAEAVGDDFQLVWHDRYAYTDRDQPVVDVYAALVNEQGYVEDGPMAIASTLGSFSHNLAAAGSLIVFTRPINDPVHDVTRVFARTIERTPSQGRRRAAG